MNLNGADNTCYLSKNALLFRVVYDFLFVEKIPYAMCACIDNKWSPESLSELRTFQTNYHSGYAMVEYSVD